MEQTLDIKIKAMLGNLDLIPEMINPEAFEFFGSNKLSRRTAKVYQLICNISKFHETTADAINWLCIHLDIQTDINNLNPEPTKELFPNIKEYIWGAEPDEETGAFFIFDSKFEENDFLDKCSKVEKYSDILIIGKHFSFDIYENAELLSAALFDATFVIEQCEFERPIVAAMIYAKVASLNIVNPKLFKNNNPDNYE